MSLKKFINIILIPLFLAIIITTNVEARQGCCSHHGGVCGCRCCDGTSLSAKCAPYYPDCNDSSNKQEPNEKEEEIKSDKKETHTGKVKE